MAGASFVQPPPTPHRGEAPGPQNGAKSPCFRTGTWGQNVTPRFGEHHFGPRGGCVRPCAPDATPPPSHLSAQAKRRAKKWHPKVGCRKWSMSDVEGALWLHLGFSLVYTRTPKQFVSVSLLCLHVLCQRQIEQSDTVGCAKDRHPVSCALSKREGAVKGRGLPSGELAAQRRSTSWTKKVQKRRSATSCVDPARFQRMTT